MLFLLVFLGCLLLYRTSKYFPKGINILTQRTPVSNNLMSLAGTSILVISAVVSSFTFGLGTGLLIFFAALMLSLCLVIIVFSLNRRLVYLLAGICVILIVIENLL